MRVKSELLFGGVSILAVMGAIAKAYFTDTDVSVVQEATFISTSDNAEAPPPSPPPERDPACAKGEHFNYASLSKSVATPDVLLNSDSGLEAVQNANGWFIVNFGTSEDPVWRLVRLYTDGSIRMGPVAPDLSLLGPSSIPEVSKSELYQSGDRYFVRTAAVTESEMGAFYTIPTNEKWKTPDGYDNGLERRARMYNEPILVGKDPVQDDDVERLRDTVFDESNYVKEQPVESEKGGQCSRMYYADTTNEPRQFGASLVTNEYPLARESDRDTQRWVDAHELGHGIARVTEAADTFNALPSSERLKILQELKALSAALAEEGRPHSYDTANEAIADLYTYLLREPALVKEHAPTAARFFMSLTEQDENLKKVLRHG